MKSRKKIANGLMEVVKESGANSTAYDRALQMATFELLLDIRQLAMIDRIRHICDRYKYQPTRLEALKSIPDLKSFVKYVPGLEDDIAAIKKESKRDAEWRVKEILGDGWS